MALALTPQEEASLACHIGSQHYSCFLGAWNSQVPFLWSVDYLTFDTVSCEGHSPGCQLVQDGSHPRVLSQPFSYCHYTLSHQ